MSVSQSRWWRRAGIIIQRGRDEGCVQQGPVCFVLSDSLKLYLVQVRAGADVREGDRVSVWNGKEGRGEEGSNTSVQVAARLSALS